MTQYFEIRNMIKGMFDRVTRQDECVSNITDPIQQLDVVNNALMLQAMFKESLYLLLMRKWGLIN